MAATGAKAGFKTKLLMDDGGGAGYVAIAEIGDVNGLDVEHVIDDATHMESDLGFEEKIAVGVKTVSDLTLSGNLLESDVSQAKLIAARDAGTKCNFRLVYPSGTKRRAFAGFVKSFGEALPMRAKMTFSVSIAVTGPIGRESHP